MQNREGLVLMRCDVCARRTWCADSHGTAMCWTCCPGAVQDAQEAARERAERAARRWYDSLNISEEEYDDELPPAY